MRFDAELTVDEEDLQSIVHDVIEDVISDTIRAIASDGAAEMVIKIATDTFVKACITDAVKEMSGAILTCWHNRSDFWVAFETTGISKDQFNIAFSEAIERSAKRG